MFNVVLIFSNQLFKKFPIELKNKKVFLIEDRRFFTDFNFHKQKLVLHRASMKFYFDFLISKEIDVSYINFSENWLKYLDTLDIKELHIVDVIDFELKYRIEKINKKIVWYENSSFLTSQSEFFDFYEGKEHYSQTSFYIYQRKRLNILVDKMKKPLEGKWSFDKENREKLPPDMNVPSLKFSKENEYVKEAKKYVEKNFSNNYGDISEFIYPIDFEGVNNWLYDFLETKLNLFGAYQDAIKENNSFLFHSVLSYALNIGLITPEDILERVFNFYKGNNVPINSLEGFIRQIIGWREFIKGMYLLKGQDQLESNFFNNNKGLSSGFYLGNTGVEPVDKTISKVIKYSYANHIERLMILGNFFLLLEIHPKQVYKWFMELFIDAYDWVMVPNIFGMSQYADGGLMVTKPYLSSSNYILKMSNYKKGYWCKIFDSLYWRFIFKNRELFEANPRLKIMSYYLNNMNREKLKDYVETADNFL